MDDEAKSGSGRGSQPSILDGDGMLKRHVTLCVAVAATLLPVATNGAAGRKPSVSSKRAWPPKRTATFALVFSVWQVAAEFSSVCCRSERSPVRKFRARTHLRSQHALSTFERARTVRKGRKARLHGSSATPVFLHTVNFVFGGARYTMSITQTDCPLVIQKLFERMRGFGSREALLKGLSFQPRPDDVLLITGMKSGTAWVQQIMHALRSGGNMDFEDINSVIPIVELYYAYGEEGDLGFLQPFEPPRYFRTHLPHSVAPKGFGKRIILIRNPIDSIVSAYFYLQNWFFDEDALSLDDFSEWMMIRDVSDAPYANAHSMQHLISWYPHLKDANVLWLHYEDLSEDLTQCIRIIAEFLELGVDDPKLLKVVEEQASFDFMKQHKSKFDSHLLRAARNEALGLPRDQGLKNSHGRVRNGQMQEGVKHLSKETIEKIDMKWKSLVEPVTGHGSYEEMRTAVNKELGRKIGCSE